jgi:1-phosphatidylinositol-3-phosphate 5-kinase
MTAALSADGRLLLKQLSRAEMIAFLKFAPHYFRHLSKALFRNVPSLLAKIYGVYEIAIRNAATGKMFRQDVLVMENLFYNRKISKVRAPVRGGRPSASDVVAGRCTRSLT